MKSTTLFLFSFLLFLSTLSCKEKVSQNDYLKKVLNNLEQIESASYNIIQEAWQPGDTTPVYVVTYFMQEYDNPADSTIGASFLKLQEDRKTFESGYDGEIQVTTYHEHKGVMINDFSTNTLPFRPMNPPFFNYTKNILRYALETKDSIQTEFNDLGDRYHFKITVHEDRQVEFFGKAHYIENPYYDTVSMYEIWINKSNHLPYKVRREMDHNISASTCLEPEFNTLSREDLNLYDYFPEDYEVRHYKDRKNSRPTHHSLLSKKAPTWTLNDINEKPVALSELKSKVLLLNFTGIGCGPCVAAVPFLKELKESFSPDEFELVAIECWAKKPHLLKSYSQKHNLNYCLLSATDEVAKAYEISSVPVYFILDEKRVIRKVIRGYGKETTDKEITDAIKELL